MVVIVLWKAVQTAVVDMVSVESTVMGHGNVAVMMAGMDRTVTLLWNRAVVMEGTTIKVCSHFIPLLLHAVTFTSSVLISLIIYLCMISILPF
jgi:hypothetical protein